MNDKPKPIEELTYEEILTLISLARGDIHRANEKILELEPELERRRLARQIRVKCPSCGGKGKTIERDWASGWDYDRECSSCNGTGYIMADPV